jgi:hypothetical protein
MYMQQFRYASLRATESDSRYGSMRLPVQKQWTVAPAREDHGFDLQR